MALYASKILKLVVDEFRDKSVREVRFVSGMSPSFVNDDGPQFLNLGRLTIERVGEIHELCRLLADEPVDGSAAKSTYTFVLRHFGRVVCKFQHRGSGLSLVMARDANACETIGAVRPKRPPSLRAEAEPESKKKGH